MLSIERKRAIVQYVKSRKIATVSELAKHFEVHEATIRRDLTSLEKDKKLKKNPRRSYDRRKSSFRTKLEKTKRSAL